MTRPRLVGPGVGAAVVAGTCWVAKAALILLTGDQPPLLYNTAFLFFPIAVVGLHAALPTGRARGRAASAGLVLAWVTELAAVSLALAVAFGPDAWEPRDDTVTVLTPLYVVAGLGSFAALLLVGLAVRRRHGLPGRARSLPVLTALAALPLLAIGSILGRLHERLVELPVLVLGVAWLSIGFALGRRMTEARSAASV